MHHVTCQDLLTPTIILWKIELTSSSLLLPSSSAPASFLIPTKGTKPMQSAKMEVRGLHLFIYLFVYYRLSFISPPHTTATSPLPVLSPSLHEEETRSCVMRCPVRKMACIHAPSTEFAPSLTTTTKSNNCLPSSQGFPAFHPAPLRLLPCLVNCLPEGTGGEDIAPCSRQEGWSCPRGTHSQGEKKSPNLSTL